MKEREDDQPETMTASEVIRRWPAAARAHGITAGPPVAKVVKPQNQTRAYPRRSARE